MRIAQKIILGFAFLSGQLLCAQHAIEGKVVSYEFFIREDLLRQHVLTQQNTSARTGTCHVEIVDSAYLAAVSPAKESFDVKFNADGQPANISYHFKSKKAAFDATVSYAYASGSTFITNGTRKKGSNEVTTHYLFTESSDKRNLYNAEWGFWGSKDTTTSPDSRHWFTKNRLMLDSVSTSKSVSSAQTIILDSAWQIDNTTWCRYRFTVHTQIPSLTKGRGKTEFTYRDTTIASSLVYRYTFDTFGNITLKEELKDGNTVSYEQWWYDQNNRLYYYGTTLGGKGLLRYFITRDDQGRPVTVKRQNNVESTTFSFTWT